MKHIHIVGQIHLLREDDDPEGQVTGAEFQGAFAMSFGKYQDARAVGQALGLPNPMIKNGLLYELGDLNVFDLEVAQIEVVEAEKRVEIAKAKLAKLLKGKV